MRKSAAVIATVGGKALASEESGSACDPCYTEAWIQDPETCQCDLEEWKECHPDFGMECD